MRVNEPENRKLKPYFSKWGIWAFSIGTSIGWGSFVVTCSTYLSQAGILGTVFGLILGMAVVLIINHNLCYMMGRSQDAGGIYAYGKKVSGDDAGFLTAWFLLLTYLAVFWANVTSLPVFMRRFLGSTFMFGFHYNVFGYDVYLGEVLLSIAAIVVFSLLCARSRKFTHNLVIALAVIFVGVVTVCTVVSLVGHGSGGYSYDPGYLPEKKHIGQIVRIAVISPWAFIGFENAAHFSEEFTFPAKKIKRVMLLSVVMTTGFYILMTLLSVSAYPEQYGSWLEYIRDMNNLSGIESIPAFYAASHYMGNAGVTMLIVALLSVIVTSLIGNMTALSRLLYAFGKNHPSVGGISKLNKRHIPGKAILFIAVISCFIPFLGRTAIGWIVDVTTIGATVIYGFQSYFVFRDARDSGDKKERVTGAFGVAMMIVFAVFLLVPKLMSYESMETESYMLFVAWSFLGLIVFYVLMRRDKNNKYGRSIVVWIVLLILMIMTIMMLVNRQTQNVTDDSIAAIREYYQEQSASDAASDQNADDFIEVEGEKIENAETKGTIVSLVVITAAVMLMLNNYRTSKKHENELEDELGAVKAFSYTDSLTGVKNKHAYIQWEERIDQQIETGTVKPFALVVCDINHLKEVNDNFGHAEGDECIRRVSACICRAFSHSPVFRFGGDEFVVILFDEDFNNREALLEDVVSYNLDGNIVTGESLAVGVAEFDAEKDERTMSVFERADNEMYINKRIAHASKENGEDAPDNG